MNLSAAGGTSDLRGKLYDADKPKVRLALTGNSDQTEILAEQVKAVRAALDTVIDQRLLQDLGCQRNTTHGNTLSGRINILKVSAHSFNEGATV